MLAEKSGDVKSVGEADLRRGEVVQVQGLGMSAFVAVHRADGACMLAVMGRKRMHG